MQIRRTTVEKTAWLPALVLRPLMWLGRHEFGVLVAVAGLTGGAWLFVVVGDEIMEGGTQAIDRTWLLGIRKFGYQNPVLGLALHEWARDITALGGIPVLALLTLIATGFLFLNGKRRMAYFICASIASGLFLTLLLKSMFQRARPDSPPHIIDLVSSSFPSGHSLMASLTYFTLAALLSRSLDRIRLKAYVLVTAVFLTFMVGLSRIYLGVHWPTDVLAGWAAGASWAAACWLAARWLQSRRKLESE